MSVKDRAAHYLARYPTAVVGGAGAAVGGALGYVAGHPVFNENNTAFRHQIAMKARKAGAEPGSDEYEKIKKDHLRKAHLGSMAVNAAIYGGLGAMTGHNLKKNLNAHGVHGKDFKPGGRFHKKNPFNGRDFSASADPMHAHHQHLGTTGKEKTKAEVKKKYREQARKHHPDLGGDAEHFKKVNNAYDHVEKSPWFSKLASGFWEGFEKQAFACKEAGIFGNIGRAVKGAVNEVTSFRPGTGLPFTAAKKSYRESMERLDGRIAKAKAERPELVRKANEAKARGDAWHRESLERQASWHRKPEKVEPPRYQQTAQDRHNYAEQVRQREFEHGERIRANEEAGYRRDPNSHG